MPMSLDFAKNAFGIFSEIEGHIYFYNSIPALPVGMPMAKGQPVPLLREGY